MAPGPGNNKPPRDSYPQARRATANDAYRDIDTRACTWLTTENSPPLNTRGCRYCVASVLYCICCEFNAVRTALTAALNGELAANADLRSGRIRWRVGDRWGRRWRQDSVTGAPPTAEPPAWHTVARLADDGHCTHRPSDSDGYRYCPVGKSRRRWSALRLAASQAVSMSSRYARPAR